MLWSCLCFATAAAAAGERVAVLPVEPRAGVLSPAEAGAVTEEIRAAAREALAAQGITVVAAEGDAASALQAGAVAALFGRAGRLKAPPEEADDVSRPPEWRLRTAAPPASCRWSPPGVTG